MNKNIEFISNTSLRIIKYLQKEIMTFQGENFDYPEAVNLSLNILSYSLASAISAAEVDHSGDTPLIKIVLDNLVDAVNTMNEKLLEEGDIDI